MKPLNLLSKTKHMLTGKDRERQKEERRRALSASAGDVTGAGADMQGEVLPAAASEPDLRDTQVSAYFKEIMMRGGFSIAFLRFAFFRL